MNRGAIFSAGRRPLISLTRSLEPEENRSPDISISLEAKLRATRVPSHLLLANNQVHLVHEPGDLKDRVIAMDAIGDGGMGQDMNAPGGTSQLHHQIVGFRGKEVLKPTI